MPQNVKSWIEIIMAALMVLFIIAIFIRSFLNKFSEVKKVDGTTTTTTKGKVGGFGARIIQLTCVTLIIPTLIILSLENIIKGETVATIIGGLIGYVLSGISNYDKNGD